jgi:hypothetical protein
MNRQSPRRRRSNVQRARDFILWGVAVSACSLTSAAALVAQGEPPAPPPVQTQITQPPPDALLPQINAALQGVTTRGVASLSKALHIGEKLEGAAPGTPLNTLAPVGDLDGDGVPEMLLKWAIPDVAVGADAAPEPDSRPLWGVYLLSWDGTQWKASRLLTGVEEFNPIIVNLGPPIGRGLAVVVVDVATQIPYPAIFQVKDHAAKLLWDAQSDDSRYQPLLQGRVSFVDRAVATTEMVVTGRADPGFLQVARDGHRGFQARAVYHWDGTAFIPGKNEFSPNEDYTLYRFVSALHLHDYASAYKLVVPEKFLKANPPTLDAFRRFIEDNWQEFLHDEIFAAPEVPAGTPDEHLFVLTKPGKRSVYHPTFSSDGKFLLTGLTRTQEAAPEGNSITN